MAKCKRIVDIKKYLVDEGIYTDKDEITLELLEITYLQYKQATENIKKQGQTIEIIDSKLNKRTIVNPSFKIWNDLQKQLIKLIENLYLTPRSRKTEGTKEIGKKENPLLNLIKEIKEIR